MQDNNLDNTTKTFEFYAMDWKTSTRKGIYFMILLVFLWTTLLIIPPITILKNTVFFSLPIWYKIGFIMWVFISLKIVLIVIKKLLSRRKIEYYNIKITENNLIISKNTSHFNIFLNEIICLKEVNNTKVVQFEFITKSSQKYSFSNSFLIKGEFISKSFNKENFKTVENFKEEILRKCFKDVPANIISSPIYKSLNIYKK